MSTEQAQTENNTQETAFPLKTIMGQKVGMTRIYLPGGHQIGVSVVYTGNCVTTGVMTPEKNGYSSVQLGVGEIREKSLNKPDVAFFQKRNVTPVKFIKEFKVTDSSKFSVGQKVSVNVFSPGDYVDVSGYTKGKGFAGVIKRHKFHRQPESHGASDRTRARGSSSGGSGAPQRVLKGTRMAGRMGDVWVTNQKLEIVKIDPENQLILIKGSVPGVDRGLVVIRETSRYVKHKREVVIAKSAKKAANVAKKSGKPAAAPVKK